MLKDLFSIEERRVSALIAGFFVVLIVYLGLILISIFTHYTVPQYIMDSLSSTLGALTLGVVGGGAVETAKYVWGKTNTITQESNQSGDIPL